MLIKQIYGSRVPAVVRLFAFHFISLNSAEVYLNKIIVVWSFCRVDYVDSLGRERRCLRKDLKQLQDMDKDFTAARKRSVWDPECFVHWILSWQWTCRLCKTATFPLPPYVCCRFVVKLFQISDQMISS